MTCKICFLSVFRFRHSWTGKYLPANYNSYCGSMSMGEQSDRRETLRKNNRLTWKSGLWSGRKSFVVKTLFNNKWKFYLNSCFLLLYFPQRRRGFIKFPLELRGVANIPRKYFGFHDFCWKFLQKSYFAIWHFLILYIKQCNLLSEYIWFSVEFYINIEGSSYELVLSEILSITLF